MRKILTYFLESYTRHRLAGHPNVVVDGSAYVARRKIRLDENLRGSRLVIGNTSWVDCAIAFERKCAALEIGDNTFIGGATISCANKISIGNNVQIAWGVVILDHNSHSLNYLDRRHDLPDRYMGKKNWDNVAVSEVVISDDVWIGLNATILKGVKIGKGVIVGAGSVVTRNIPDMVVVAGNPARIIKQLDGVISNEDNKI